MSAGGYSFRIFGSCEVAYKAEIFIRILLFIGKESDMDDRIISTPRYSAGLLESTMTTEGSLW